MSMFCYQCQETARNSGCTIKGVCGKLPQEAKLEDLLMYSAKGISLFSNKLRHIGKLDSKRDYFLLNLLFMTITNANFDEKKLYRTLLQAIDMRDELHQMCLEHNIEIENKFAHLLEPKYVFSNEELMLEKFADKIGVLRNTDIDRRSLVETVLYGLKGMAAYLEHAANLGYENENITSFVERALIMTEDCEVTNEELIQLILDTGMYGVEAMALLDKAHNETFGHPEITSVDIGVGTNPGILITGHDLHDLKMLLDQTRDTGIDVYTHSEMLPGHYYPELKKYPHFKGNYGGSWWLQTKEFQTFNGPILFTSNCIVPFRKGENNFNYVDKVFTTNASGMTGCKHIDADEEGWKDFSPIIELAKTCAPPVEIEKGKIVGGFAHHQVLQLADKIIEAVQEGKIKKFIVMGGCDGRMQDRKYYEDFAKALPKDTVILTAGCAKYRYNKLPLGTIGEIPRVLDAGQCNDSYSLAVIALKLKEVLGLEDINDLPIVYNIAWYEQKAVIVLLALLYLGVKNIHLGPTLPAFISPNVLKVLVNIFGISKISTVEEDLEKFGLNY